MDISLAAKKLASIDQQHLLDRWEDLNNEQKEQLLGQIAHLDAALFKRQRRLLQDRHTNNLTSFEPFSDYHQSGNRSDQQLGEKLLKEGKVACVIVAGGQGTRLHFPGPKGQFPITVIKKKSLFQLFAEKTAAASTFAGRALPLAIMTSPINHKHTLHYFEEFNNFGLNSEQLSFFSQSTLPYLDQKGDLFLENPATIAVGPDGNGSFVKHLVDSFVWERWKRAGVEMLAFVQIDNPLADPFDTELFGFHRRNNCDATVKCIERNDPDEKVGIIVSSGKGPRIVEYNELPEAEKKARDAKGHLRYPCANISLFCLSMDFIQSLALNNYEHMPYHLAFKAVNYLSNSGETIRSKEPVAWKFEKYVFDILPLAQTVNVLQYPRRQCFAPLKNASGKDSLEEVQRALQDRDREIITALTKKQAPKEPFELSQEFYYPTEEIKQKWKNRPAPSTGYINA